MIATGFTPHSVDAGIPQMVEAPKKYELNNDDLKEITQKVETPTQVTPTQATPAAGPTVFEEEEAAEPFIVERDATPLDTQEEVEAGTQSLDQVTPSVKEELSSSTETPTETQTRVEMAQHETIEEESVIEEEPVDEMANRLFESQPMETEDAVEPELSFDYEEVAKEIDAPLPDEPKVQMYNLMEDTLENSPPPTPDTLKITDNDTEIVNERPSREELIQKNKDRESKVKELTLRLKTPSGLADLESEPAFKRRNVELDNIPHSSESNTSRYTLTEEVDDEGKTQVKLKDNNSFLHDNVD